MSKWLQAIGMGQYTTNFLDKGFATPHQILEFKEEDLEALGIASIGHRKKILKATSDTKEQVSKCLRSYFSQDYFRDTNVSDYRFFTDSY